MTIQPDTMRLKITNRGINRKTPCPAQILSTWQNLSLCFLLLFMVSCSKDRQLDRNLLSLNGANGSFSYLQTSNLVKLNGNDYSLDKSFTGLPIKLSEAASSQDTITAVVDPSLILSYNNLHNERNPLIPEGVFGVSNRGKFAVSAGESQLKDSLYVTLTNGSNLIHNTVYLVPVRLTANGKSKITIPTVYFKVLFTVAPLNARWQGVSVLPSMIVSRLTGGTLSVFCNAGCPDSLKFRIALNTRFPIHETDVEASLLSEREVDSLVTANSVYGLRMPSSVYSLTKNLVKVPTTSILSRDSITVRFTNKALLTPNIYNYMGLKIIQHTRSAYGVSPIASDSAKVLLRVMP